MPMTLGPATDPVSTSGLRVFQPPIKPARSSQITTTPLAFADFDAAFQNATGWKVAWNPSGESLSRGKRSSVSGRKNHDWIRIADLSDRLPPGVPAVSRIYCENMILKLNRVFTEFSENGKKLPEVPDSRRSTEHLANEPESPEPCFLDSLSVVPIVSTPLGNNCSTGFQWSIRNDGSVMVGAFEISGPPGLNRSGLVAAQASFLAASRFGGDCSEVVRQVRSGIHQVFCGDVDVQLVVWALDPLLGFATICGDDHFDIRLDKQEITVNQEAMTGFMWLRGQNLVMGNRTVSGSNENDEESTEWFHLVERATNRSTPVDWPAAIKEQLSRAIPRLQKMPNVALAMARH